MKHGPTGVALGIWIAGELVLALLSPRYATAWQDFGTAAQEGPNGWRVLLAWGGGSRWLQAEPADAQVFADGCGAAVLARLLRTRGVVLPQTLLWSLTRLPAGGTTLQRMLEIAASFGVHCRVVALPLREGSTSCMGSAPLPVPCVLHLRRAHFVLLLRMTAADALILDPALGRITVPRRIVQRQASGLALTCTAPDASPQRARFPGGSAGPWSRE